MNKASDGNTSQKTLVANALTLSTSLVSIYSYNMASTETRGMDANMAPTRVLRLATSDITTTRIVVITIFNQ